MKALKWTVLLGCMVIVLACGGPVTPQPFSGPALPGATPPGAHPVPTAAVVRPLPVAVLPYDYQEKSVGEGWKIGIVRLYFLNTSDQPIPPQRLQVTDVVVETLEGQTYPADLINPDEGRYSEELLREGQYNWRQPKEVVLGVAALGGDLPIPPHFPFYWSPAGFGNYQYGVGFRFAEAAHPIRIILDVASYEQVRLDLGTVRATITDPSPFEVGARPMGELAARSAVDNEKFRFTWDGTCVNEEKPGAQYGNISLPYTLLNKDAFNEQRVFVGFAHATYAPGGDLFYWEEDRGAGFELTVGPGQTIRDVYSIEAHDLWMGEPAASYLIVYELSGGIAVYQLDCTMTK